MKSSEITKNKVLKEAILLFNTKGYKTTSLSDITSATGLTKGAIYRHFENKEALEIAAFEKIMLGVFNKMHDLVKNENNAKDKLFAVLNVFHSYIKNPILKGGCPLLNAAVEADDTNLDLKIKAQKALVILKNSVETILFNGIKHQQIKPNTNIVQVATIIIATLEGGIMMSNLQDTNTDIDTVVTFLKKWMTTEIFI